MLARVRGAGRNGIVAVMVETYLSQADAWAVAHADIVREAGEHWLASGEWLPVTDLGRSWLRRGGGGDPFSTIRGIPLPLGTVDRPADRLVLRARALTALPAAETVLDGFVRLIHLAASRFIAEETGGLLLGSHDLTETLSMKPALAVRVAQLLFGEDWMLGGGSGDPAGEWERRIDEHILPLLHAQSLSDYLLIEGQRFWSQPATHDLHAPAQLVDAAAGEPVAQTPPEPALRVGELHPTIAKAAAGLLAAEAYDSAVREAALAFRDLLREHSGRHDLDGVDLAGAALGGSQPPIVLADLQTPDGRNEQKGWLMLAQGCFAAIRNPVAHRAVYRERASAMEALATMSFVATWVTANDPWPLPRPGSASPSGSAGEPE